jgi:hypothetical protein
MRHRKLVKKRMAGRPAKEQSPGEEPRDKRITLRWTASEYERLQKARKLLGITYLADVPRILTLRQLDLMEPANEEIVAE